MALWDVIVVGLGPTGSTLANLLGMQGLRVLAVERDPAIHALPRAVHFDDEVMRVFQTIGVADQVAAIARVNPGMRFVDGAGRTLLDWPRPMQVGPHGWHASYRFHQPDLDAILRARLDAHPGVRPWLGAEVTAVRDDGACASVEIQGPDGTQTHQARYVVGCDGARSTVRARIGGGSIDMGFHERWLVVDMMLTRDKPALGDLTIQHCDPDNPATYVRGPGLRRRWEIALTTEPPDIAAEHPDEVWRRLARWLSPDEAVIERSAIYTFHALLAARWRQGRLLIAGDAAHQTPPFMGQGMCAGIRDAANLAWKLGACLTGRADDTLLDSYQTERQDHARIFIETAVKLGRLVNASGSAGDLEAAFRQPDGSVRMASLLPRLGPGLADPADGQAGTLFAQPTIGGARLDDLCGYGPCILAQAAFCDAVGLVSGGTVMDAATGRADIALLRVEPGSDAAALLDGHGAGALVLRPDRYSLGAASDAASLHALIRRIP